ncbi:DUF6201 family protein [Plesiomonas shigelloides]|uniref:DUF6201 family protein n=1 Tax=Plesiomonas shigelloides TaxID=703 RepID=UPI0039B122A4
MIYWLRLAHLPLNFLDEMSPVNIFSDDDKYKAYLKSVCPVNPTGIYCLFTNE